MFPLAVEFPLNSIAAPVAPIAGEKVEKSQEIVFAPLALKSVILGLEFKQVPRSPVIVCVVVLP